MSDDLIRRSDAIKALDATFTIKGKENTQTVLNYLELVRTRIEGAPTIEPKRGEWVYKPYVYDESTWECSNCKEPWTLIDGTPQDNNMNFCPNCGADMREREGE